MEQTSIVGRMNQPNLVHTLLFLLRHDQDLMLAVNCLESLEGSTHRTVVIYNQGDWSNDRLRGFLKFFRLDCHVIGEGINVGTSVGRQKCFAYIWQNMPGTQYISELHLDMIFSNHWEDALVRYLENSDEPMISCGIVDKGGNMPFLEQTVALPSITAQLGDFVAGLRTDRVVHGFTNPCVHKSEILQETGGYHTEFLRGTQCFEDDSMLLGYYYYYGTRRRWQPKVNYNSVVYHELAGQRLTAGGGTALNYAGLVKQYGAMGLKALSELHNSAWHKGFFSDRYKEEIK